MRLQKTIVFALAFNFALNSFAKEPPFSKPVALAETKAAACAPATALRDLEWNNVKALIETGGSMWQDRSTANASYEVPKGGGVSSLYAGALWMGGLSSDQQLKLAAVTFRTQGNDYWTGPLTNTGTAEVSAETCEDWDRFFITYRKDAALHQQYHDCLESGTVAECFPDGYSTPSYFYDYQGNGNLALDQDQQLLPFYDRNMNLVYEPELGDYPGYDVLNQVDCKSRDRRDPVPLYGDITYSWIFNDKGNVHSETAGQPIGMEVRAQAFAYSTNDEVNNMTFYNYVLINQGTQQLHDTWFGVWADTDLGNSTDDYVGCDVQRGLGYCYNGDGNDETSSNSPGYGEAPPAVGIDFFEGPYADDDQKDNPLTTDIAEAIAENGIPYNGLGIGYGDGVVDNERFGMRSYVYYNGSANPLQGEPNAPVHYYYYMQARWKNGDPMHCGGDALFGHSGVSDVPCTYMFPGDSDPLNWGSGGISAPEWTEQTAGNPAADRRMIQSAGPFTLDPGEYNNITFGVVWARSFSGDPFESVELLRIADDKAQALFDNCFEIISGPDAPDVSVQELDREIILYLTNENGLSNNHHENYIQFDPAIPEEKNDSTLFTEEERSYKFEGYVLYQLKDETVSADQLNDITMARLIAQCDIENDVSDIINYYRDPISDEITPQLMVQGENAGIRHTFQITTDQFAQGDNRLVNHRTYHFMAIAYGYNNYEDFDLTILTGQDEPFLASRKGSSAEIKRITAIPHKVDPENGGSQLHSAYGTTIALTQHEGMGNAHRFIRMSDESRNEILENGSASEIIYTHDGAPVEIKVVDPLLVPSAGFQLMLATENEDLLGDDAKWKLVNTSTGDEWLSLKSIQVMNEELIIPWGLSITWKQYHEPTEEREHYTDFAGAEISFEDPATQWLLGFNDDDSFSEFNWIRSGQNWVDPLTADIMEYAYNDYSDGNSTSSVPALNFFTDAEEQYENVLSATWSPYCLAGSSRFIADQNLWLNIVAPTSENLKGDISPIQQKFISNISGLNNVDVVITDDKSLWTRCPVFEMNPNSALTEGNREKMQLRAGSSLGKNGQPDGSGTGFSWFPGYAIDVSTGERLNMAFGEDSWLVGENGRDMIWNPSSRVTTNIGAQVLCGGQHWIYVFKNMNRELDDEDFMPAYDEGQFVKNMPDANGELTTAQQKKIFNACTWVGSAILNPDFELKSMNNGIVPCDVEINLRVAKTYSKFSSTTSDLEDYTEAQNWWNPMYSFSTSGLEATVQNDEVLTSALDLISVVPNPYYAYSEYEQNKLDNRIKITNLPPECVVTIYNINGTLIRQYNKSDPLTSLDWDLKNEKNIPIASGVYIIHINVDGIGEKTLKWFGVMRPVDLDNF